MEVPGDFKELGQQHHLVLPVIIHLLGGSALGMILHACMVSRTNRYDRAFTCAMVIRGSPVVVSIFFAIFFRTHNVQSHLLLKRYTFVDALQSQM